MAARTFFLPGIILLFCAFILSLLVAVSLPALPALDIVRCHFPSGLTLDVSSIPMIKEIRLGIWAYCVYDAKTGQRTCVDQGHGYKVDIIPFDSNSVTFGSGATRGLAVHPVATVVTFIALLFSLSSHVTLALFSIILSFIAAFLTLIAFAIDIALYIIVHDRVQRILDGQVRTVAAPGVWITLVSLILLLMATCAGWLGRRRSRMAGTTDHLPSEKPGVLAMFRRS
ncbi:hypothetical protein BJV77DRAFT_454072 [Russula vinacea]|nr:hypothetical protein BJV77DRAFT_454072 [Russula vinacea]